MNLFKIIGDIEKFDPEVHGRLDSRRAVFKNLASFGKKVAVASVPLAFGSVLNKAYGQTSDAQKVIDTLNFALTLEYLEDEFYKKGIMTAGLIPAADLQIFQQIGKHETSHVAFLTTVIRDTLKGTPVAKPNVDYTGSKNGARPALLPTVFSDYTTFKALAQGFEDTGVRAYKGQATNLVSNNVVLDAALRIHSVEARHAAEIRRLNGKKPWIEGNDMGGPAPGITNPIYAGEENTTHAGFTRAQYTTMSDAAATRAFDEPLTKEAVLEIAGNFIY